MTTIKIKENDVRKDCFKLSYLHNDTTCIENLNREELIDLTQQFNNEVLPLIGEENLYERD